MLRIGIVGAGYIARQHMIRVNGIRHARVEAVCDPLPNLAHEAILQTLGDSSGARPYTSLSTMLDAEQLTAIFICIPPFAHGDVERRVIAARIPFLVEKPVSTSLEIASEIAHEVERAGLVTASGYQTRYSDMIPFVKEALNDRPVTMAVAHRFSPFPTLDWYRNRSLSGGQVVEMATHQVDTLRTLVSEIQSVYAVGTRSPRLDRDGDIFDAEAAVFTFTNGAIGTLNTNLLSGHGKPGKAKGMHLFADNITCSVIGYEGSDRSIELVEPGGSREVVFADDAMAAQDAAFLSAVRERDRSLVLSDYANGLRTLGVTLAIQHSSMTGQAVSVDEFMGVGGSGNSGRALL